MSVLEDVYRRAILPAHDLLPARMASLEATVMLLAIGLQESRLIHRRQIGGPARGLWQFERGGGTVGVLNHRASRQHARDVCAARGVRSEAVDVYPALEHDDVLAAAFARLLLWTDSRPLPALGDADGAWAYYIRNWRPGRPRREHWQDNYPRAVEVTGAA